MVCSTLSQLGPDAAPHLIKVLSSDKLALRKRAADQLGFIKPTTPKVIDTLIALLDDKEHDVRLYAIKSLDTIGEPANKATPKLQSILNSLDDKRDSETLRSAAKEALKSVDPRKTFVN